MKKTALITLLITAILSSTAFTATPEDHWFKSFEPQVIEKVPYAKMYSEAFNPDAFVTYGDFAQIAAIAINRAISYDAELQDECITRIDALEIICERLGYTNTLSDTEQVLAAASIADFNEMTTEQKSTALIAYNKGLIKGDENGRINPDSNITFAELLVIFSRRK